MCFYIALLAYIVLRFYKVRIFGERNRLWFQFLISIILLTFLRLILQLFFLSVLLLHILLLISLFIFNNIQTWRSWPFNLLLTLNTHETWFFLTISFLCHWILPFLSLVWLHLIFFVANYFSLIHVCYNILLLTIINLLLIQSQLYRHWLTNHSALNLNFEGIIILIELLELI